MDSSLSAKVTVPPLPDYYVERENLKNIFSSADRKNIYICAGPGCGKTTALASLAAYSDKVLWLSISSFDSLDSLRTILNEAIDTEMDRCFSVSDMLCVYARDCTLIIDDIDRFYNAELFENIALNGNIRFAVSTTEYISDIKDIIDKTDGIFISDSDLRLTDDEVKAVCGCNNDELIHNIGGYAAGAVIAALNGAFEFSGKTRFLLSGYIYEKVFAALESDKRRLIADTVLADTVPTGLCEYLYGASYGRHIADGLKHNFFIEFEDECFRLHPLIKAAVADNCGMPQNSVNEKILSYYDETDNHKSYIRYCMLLGKRNEAADCLDLYGFELLDDGEFEFLDTAIGFTEGLNDKRMGISAVKGALCVLRGDYNSGYNLCRLALENFAEYENDARLIYCAVFTSRALRNTSHLKEALNVINDADKLRKNFGSLYGYFIDAEKIAVLNDMSNFAEAYGVCIKGIELCSVKGDIRVKRLYERLSCCVYYFSKRLARAVYAYDKSKKFEKEDYWIKKRSEIYMYGLGALHIIGDRKRAAEEFSEMKKALIESGMTGEIWYGELHYLKIAMYADVFDETAPGESFTDCIRFMEAYAPNIKNHNIYIDYLDIVKELYEAINNGKINEETFFDLPEKIDKLNFSAGIECLCAYMKVLTDRNDVEHIIPIVDSIISEAGGMLNVFFVNVVMDIALNCFNQGKDDQAEEYIMWLCDCASDVGDMVGIDKDKLKMLAVLSDYDTSRKVLSDICVKCCLEDKKVYAEIFGEFNVITEDYSAVKWRTSKTKDVMAYLVCMDGEGVTKNRIIENVWGEEASKALTPIFNTSMYNLRKSLGDGGEIIFNNNMYYIDKNAVGSDYVYFKAAAEDFEANPIPINALRVLSWFSPLILAGTESIFAAPVKRVSLKTAKEAVLVLCKNNLKDLVRNIIDRWPVNDDADLFISECRKMT